MIIIATGILLCIGLFYYLITYRFKESLRYAVKVQTKGQYVFDAGVAEVSFWKRAIRLKRSSVHCVDPRDKAATYDVEIPEMYFSLASWKDLLMNRKMIVDSMAFISPHLKMYVQRKPVTGAQRVFKGSDILHILKKTLTHFNAHAFNLQGASYDYIQEDATVLHVNDINLYVKNFTEINNQDDHLFGSERVVLSLGRQRWVLPKRKQAVSFSALRFDSKGQRLELDSLDYNEQDSANNPGMSLKADKIFFNSRNLPAFYQRDHLLIDTLTCLNPVLTVPPGRHGKDKKDTLLLGSRMPFQLMRIGFINVVNADVHLQGRQAASRNSNLRIYNLRVDPKATRPLSIDSVRMDLRQMVFYSRDSLYQMRINEFAIEKDGILFQGVTYTPTEKNHADKTVTATAPALRLKHVDFEALMRKHLHADEAELISPVITLHRQSGAPSRSASSKRAPVKNLDIFYQTLHGISEIVHVEHFRLRDGELGYKAGGEKGTSLAVSDINAHILLNKLFRSDSLVDIKHAIPDLRVGSLQLSSKGTVITVLGYRLDGVTRHNFGAEADILLPNGTRLLARDIYWEVFDWDVYQHTRDIQIDYFKASSVMVSLKGGKKEGETKAHHNLPVVRIAKLEVDEFSFSHTSPEGKLLTMGSGLLMEKLRTEHRFFVWNSIQAQLSTVNVTKRGFVLEAGPASIHSGKESTIRNINFVSAAATAMKVSLPSLRFRLPLYSTDFNTLRMPYLYADNADVEWCQQKHEHAQDTSPKGIKLPFALEVGEIGIKNTHVDYTGIGPKDTLRLDTRLQVNIRDLRSIAEGIRFHSADIVLTDSKVKQPELTLALPHTRLQLSGGEINSENISAEASLSLNGGGFRFAKGNTTVTGERLAGDLSYSSINLKHGETFDWRSLVPGFAMEGGKINFSSDKMNAGAGSFKWVNNTFRLDNIFMQPHLDRETHFKNEKWQGDYITVEDGSIALSGFDPARIGESVLRISKAGLDGVKMTVSRDKHLPLQHGIEKEMPTKLIGKITMSFRVDTVAISNSTIIYSEHPAKSDQWNEIPLTGVQGTILNFGNRFGGNDSLLVYASGNVFNGSIRHLVYRESYADSLSGFTASLGVSPASLPELGGKAMPRGNIKITKGYIDTVSSTWKGNKYAAYGQMHFYYHDLKLRISDKRHPDKWRPLPAVETWLANLLLPSRITRPSFIFTERNREKFVFNYWILVQKSGVMSSLRPKRDRAYRKQYNKYRQQYYLPPLAAGYK